MNIKNIFLTAAVIAAAILVSFSYISYRESAIAGYVEDYQKMSHRIERLFIENIPVYRDFAKPQMIAELQKFDLPEHAAEVVKHGISPMKNSDDINKLFKEGKLLQLSSDGTMLYYFHNVQKENRFLTQEAKKGLEMVTERFQQKLKNRNAELPAVKLAVSSVIRTVDYQEKIFGRKFVSLHSYGGCFDIFYEDYYVQLPSPEKNGGVFDRIKKSLHERTGFLMGDALREQFRTVLMETLLELQREGALYAFLEDDRRCYHITPLVK